MQASLSTRFPLSPTAGSFKKRILHLGPDYRLAPPNATMSPEAAQLHSPAEDGKAKRATSKQRDATQAAVVRSPILVSHTYERIRVVQASMGYTMLLPVPKTLVGLVQDSERYRPGGGGLFGEKPPSQRPSPRVSRDMDIEAEPDVRAWTRRRAAECLAVEMQALLRELVGEDLREYSVASRGSTGAEGASPDASEDSGAVPSTNVGPVFRPL